jgi:plastocyanin
MSRNTYKIQATFIATVLSVAILLYSINLVYSASGQSKTAFVSIVKGASEPNTKEPYNPSPIGITVGTNVTWKNSDITAHTVTEGSPSGNTPQNGFDSSILAPGQTFSHTFDKPGTTQYYCTLHPTMLGEIIAK